MFELCKSRWYDGVVGLDVSESPWLRNTAVTTLVVAREEEVNGPQWELIYQKYYYVGPDQTRPEDHIYSQTGTEAAEV